MTVATELENAPFAEIIKTVGIGIAEAQYELDLVSVKIARMMAGYMPDPDADDGSPSSTPTERNSLINIGDGNTQGYSLLELGFTPTFYQFVDTLIEVKMSFSMSRTTNTSFSSTAVAAQASGRVGLMSARGQMSGSVVSARYSSKYQYSAEGSSLVRTKLVPVPAPAVLEERIRNMIAASLTPSDGN